MSDQRVCRVGDTCAGICMGHSPSVSFTATFNTGSSVCTADGQPVVLVGHTGPASCGHTAKVTTGSPVSFVAGIPVARIGDSVTIVEATTSTGTITSGSPNVTSF